MQPFLTKRGLFAASILTISAIAATSSHASADDGGLTDAGGAADAAADAAEVDAAGPEDAVSPTGTDATVGADGATPEAAAPSGPAYVTPDGALPPYSGGDIFQRLCVDTPNVTSFNFSTVPAAYADAAGCNAYNDEGHAAAHSCLCNNCFPLMQQCDSLQGCREILKCEFDSGCTDSTSCYLAPGAPCSTVIDAWGTGSVATALTQYLTACGAKAATPCPNQ